MTAELAANELMSVADYLEWEEAAEVRHEYVGGVVYDMAGGTNGHAAIATNTLGLLHAQLSGKKCRPFNSDTKLRIIYPSHARFYYPDAMVVCHPGPSSNHFQDYPSVVIEVASGSTRRTDSAEKRDAYLLVSTLNVYILIEQDEAAAVVWRRGDQGFKREVYLGLNAVIELPEIEARLALEKVYEAVDLPSPNSKA